MRSKYSVDESARQVRLAVHSSLLAALALACCLPAGGCLQRVETEPALSATTAEQSETWEYAGSFGGHAEVTRAGADPWQVRFRPGSFKLISGLHVTAQEVWVCDLGISRLQVFDYEGSYLRSVGAGVQIDVTLANDEDLYYEDKNYDKQAKPPRWEDGQGARWAEDRVNLFKVCDVAVVPEGLVVADQARSSMHNEPKRRPRVVLRGENGGATGIRTRDMSWPEYLAVQGTSVAVTEPQGNVLWLAEMTEEDWPQKLIPSAANFRYILEAKLERQGKSDYMTTLALAAGASSLPGKFNNVGGVCLAFGKAIVCDTGNRRLQVFDARREQFTTWGKLIRVIPSRKRDGRRRFDAPRDLDVDLASGRVFVLDAARHEVAVLSPTFDRIGSFGRDELVEPYAVDVSPDGGHCFITDRRSNLVHHYVRSS